MREHISTLLLAIIVLLSTASYTGYQAYEFYNHSYFQKFHSTVFNSKITKGIIKDYRYGTTARYRKGRYLGLKNVHKHTVLYQGEAKEFIFKEKRKIGSSVFVHYNLDDKKTSKIVKDKSIWTSIKIFFSELFLLGILCIMPIFFGLLTLICLYGTFIACYKYFKPRKRLEDLETLEKACSIFKKEPAKMRNLFRKQFSGMSGSAVFGAKAAAYCIDCVIYLVEKYFTGNSDTGYLRVTKENITFNTLNMDQKSSKKYSLSLDIPTSNIKVVEGKRNFLASSLEISTDNNEYKFIYCSQAKKTAEVIKNIIKNDKVKR